MNPVTNDNKMASEASLATGGEANVATIKDMIAVGPRVMSLEVPSTVYTKQPIKEEYSPYWKVCVVCVVGCECGVSV